MELFGYTEQRNYKPGYAAMKYKERFGVWPSWAWTNHCEQHGGIDPSMDTLRWVKSRDIAYHRAKAKARDYTPNRESTQLWLEDTGT